MPLRREALHVPNEGLLEAVEEDDLLISGLIAVVVYGNSVTTDATRR